jgi:hypothetical protein
MILLIALIIAAAGLVLWSEKLKRQERERVHRGWLGLPAADKYNQRNPLAENRRNGSICCYCGSGSIRNFGLVLRNDQRRIHACNHCNAKLYRSSR